MEERSFRKAIESVIGLKYRLGSDFEDSGSVDCFSMIRLFIKKMYGVNLPNNFEGRTHQHIAAHYNVPERKKAVVGKLYQYLNHHLIPMGKSEYKPGDILVCDFARELCTFGIAAGSGKMVTAIPFIGIIPVSLGDYSVDRVFRCQVV